MKAEELRIKNWVYSDEIGKPVQIELISIDNWVSFGLITFDQPTIEEINPIPLTEEWLLKLGFNNGNEEVSKCDLWGKWWVGDVEITKESDNGWDYNGVVSIKHVHQLQNLYFALTGEELVIKDGI